MQLGARKLSTPDTGCLSRVASLHGSLARLPVYTRHQLHLSIKTFRCRSSGGGGSSSGPGDKGDSRNNDYGRLEFDQSSGGDGRVQDTLVDILGLQIGKKQVEDFTEQEKQKLIKGAEEIKEEVDRVAAEQMERSEEAFGAALEGINRSADEFEEQLRKSREQMQADAADFAAWKRRMATERSAGQFFKSLYVDKDDDDDIRQLLLGEDREALKRRAAEVQASINQELSSKRRIWLFGFLSLVLALVCAIDATSESPSWPQIGLYMTLAGVFGTISLAERRFLQQWRDGQAAASSSSGGSGSSSGGGGRTGKGGDGSAGAGDGGSLP